MLKGVGGQKKSAGRNEVFKGSGTRKYTELDAADDAGSPPGQDRFGGCRQTGTSAGGRWR
jgi:hypothetical protein